MKTPRFFVLAGANVAGGVPMLQARGRKILQRLPLNFHQNQYAKS